jgi:catechol 2,3-dioxygenase-like lactoylglutathione lyase family enzyme
LPSTRAGPENCAVPDILRLDHVQLAMPPGEEERAVVFYEGLLGIPRVPKPAPLAARGGCWFERGDLRVHLGVEADFRPARKAHPAFAVSSLAELVERLGGAGVEVRPGDAVNQVYVDDPFGNRIELIEPAP